VKTTIQGRVKLETAFSTPSDFINDEIDALKQVACGLTPPSVTGKNPFNVFTYNSYVGQTTIDTEDVGSITVVTEIDQDLAIQAILDRLNAGTNQACLPMNY
jgi:hypothetical protein